MYKLLIADDEPLVLIGLESMLPWNDMDITVCGRASNGKQALELIESLKPDLVITDIKMPLINGLEVLEECQKRFSEPPEFIILTCYEDFPYIKTALKYQAVDYIIKLGLKPEELASAISHAIAMRKQKYARSYQKLHTEEQTYLEQYKNRFFLNLLHNLFESEEQFQLQIGQLNLSFHADNYAVASCQMISQRIFESNDSYMTFYHSVLSMLSNLLSKSLSFHLTVLDMMHFCILFEFQKGSVYLDFQELQDLLTDIFQTIENYFNVKMLCGIGDYKGDIHLISESYQEARQIHSFCTEEIPVLVYAYQNGGEATVSLKNIFQVTILKEDLHKAFCEYDVSAFCHIIDSVGELFRNYPSKYIQAMDLVSKILHFCLANMPDSESYLNKQFSGYRDSYCSIYNQNSMEKILRWVEQFRDAVLEYYDNRYKDQKNELIQSIIQYIESHLSEKLLLNDVADAFSISPNYLGHLFKKSTAMGFNEYVTKAKISRAKSLLFNRELKLYEVSSLLGYENYFYFSRVFKKVEGCSPSQYIQKNEKFFLQEEEKKP